MKLMKLEIYRRDDGLYAWRLRARNGRIIATDGGQGYVKKKTCRRMAESIVFPDPDWTGYADVVDLAEPRVVLEPGARLEP